ncbi:phosphatase and actin regulator 2 [Trichonephila clavipes]|nr:phosphatase and actin regulator 2 [Trichonephila clavipes]
MGIIREKCSHCCSPIVLCKKVNGAMKTSSVGSNSRSPTSSPMENKHSRFAMLRRLFKPWQWKRKKKGDRFEQTSRTLERKISMHSTKEELNSPSVTYTSFSVLETYNTVVVTNSGFLLPYYRHLRIMPCLFSSGLHEKKRNKYRCGQRTVRLAVVESVVESSSN